MVRTLVLLILLALSAAARAEVVYLPTEPGAERFRRAASEPEALALFAYVETEARQTFCGPASLAAALNSIGIGDPTPAPMFPYHLLTQDSLFTARNQAVKSYAAVERDGLTLNQLAQFAANLAASTEVIHALDVSADALRSRLRAALGTRGTRVLVNYSRIPLGQVGDGHISPLAAYDAQTDSFLILDVARYKYPPAWVSFDQLFAAMQRIDTDSGLSRGALILSNPAQAPRP
jgi:hypothetical protein